MLRTLCWQRLLDNLRICQLADCTTRGLVNSRMPPATLRAQFSFFWRHLRNRELSSPRVVHLPWQLGIPTEGPSAAFRSPCMSHVCVRRNSNKCVRAQAGTGSAAERPNGAPYITRAALNNSVMTNNGVSCSAAGPIQGDEDEEDSRKYERKRFIPTSPTGVASVSSVQICEKMGDSDCSRQPQRQSRTQAVRSGCPQQQYILIDSVQRN